MGIKSVKKRNLDQNYTSRLIECQAFVLKNRNSKRGMVCIIKKKEGKDGDR